MMIYDTRLYKLKFLSLFNRRFIRDVTFLFDVINGRYDIDIQTSSYFVRTETVYNLRKNDTQDIAPNFYSFF